PSARKIIEAPFNITTYLANTKAQFKELNKYNLLDKSIRIDEVNIIAKRNNTLPLNFPNSKNAMGTADALIKKDRLEYAPDIFSVFFSAPGLTVRNNMVYRTSQRSTSITGGNQPVLIILDGVKLPASMASDILVTLNPRNVEGIEILTNQYNLAVLGDEAAGGAVFITSKAYKDRILENSNMVTAKNKGFTLNKEFYFPAYDVIATNRNIQDLRSTIFWGPKVITDTNGQARVNFYNAGAPANYRVVIEGMDVFGNIGRKVYTYEVK
ncbi:MAG: hypothetical protein EOO89_24005, partial [Pedobacter sp.]